MKTIIRIAAVLLLAVSIVPFLPASEAFATATPYINLMFFGSNNSTNQAAIIAANPKHMVGGSSVGPMAGSANISAYNAAGIKYYEYLDGGYEGTTAGSYPISQAANLAYITAVDGTAAYGVFIDHVTASPDAADLTYLSALYSSANSKGLSVVLNVNSGTWSNNLMDYCDYILSTNNWTTTSLTASQALWAGRTWLLSYNVADVSTAAGYTNSAKAAGISSHYSIEANTYLPTTLPSYLSAYITAISGTAGYTTQLQTMTYDQATQLHFVRTDQYQWGTFSVNNTFALSKVTVKIGKIGTPTTFMRIGIKAADGSSHPTGAYLWYSDFYLASYTGQANYDFIVSPAVTLNSGNRTYGIEAESLNVGTNCFYFGMDDLNNRYSGGESYKSTDGGATWTIYPGSTGDAYVILYSEGVIPDALTTVSASDGTYPDKVRISWTKVTGATNYHVWRDAVDLGSAGDVSFFDDTGAAAPTLTPGTTNASDNTNYSYVNLSLVGASTANGTSYNYKVIASNDAGSSADSNIDAGFRGYGTPTYQWYRSATDNDSDYSAISGATTSPYQDIGAPANGDGRYYYCVITIAGGTITDNSTADRGYRKVGTDATPPTVVTVSVTNIGLTTATINCQITDIGTSNLTQRGVQWGVSSGSYPVSVLETGGNWGAGTYSESVTNLPQGTVIYVRALGANTDWGYGNELSFTTISNALNPPGSPTGTIGGGWVMVPTDPAAPNELFREGGTTFPWATEIQTLATESGAAPYQWFMAWIAVLTSLAGGLWVFAKMYKGSKGKNQSIFVFWMVSTVIMCGWVFGGGGVVQGWILIPYGLIGIFVMVWFNPFKTAAV